MVQKRACAAPEFEAAAEYTAVAKALHWLIAILIAVQIPLGVIMVNMREANEAAIAAQTQPPYQLLQIFELFQLHKSLGITVLGLVLLRILWRFFRPPPALPATISGLERRGAKAAHLLLYLLMLALPVSGWIIVSVESETPVPTVLFKTLPWPHIPILSDLPKDMKATLDPIATSAHAILGWILAVVVVIHVAAALRHGLFLKDGVMSRMIPRLSRKSRMLASLLFGIAALFGLASSWPASASEWSIQPEKSTISFIASAGGAEYRGTVGDYQAEVLFDPEAPHIASLRIAIPTSALTFGRKDYDEAVHAAEWLDAAGHPVVRYAANGAEEIGDNQYRFDGKLMLKGVTKPVSVPFTIEIEEGEASVTGELVINRSEFGVGSASFAGVAVADEVKIVFDIKALELTN